MNTNLKKVLAQFACEGLDPKWTEVTLAAHRELAALESDERLLAALKAAGVDNWDGWDIALENM